MPSAWGRGDTSSQNGCCTATFGCYIGKEAITSDSSGMNDSVTYIYASVGNRKQKVATLPGYPGG
jgi:hypothetical protein